MGNEKKARKKAKKTIQQTEQPLLSTGAAAKRHGGCHGDGKSEEEGKGEALKERGQTAEATTVGCLAAHSAVNPVDQAEPRPTHS